MRQITVEAAIGAGWDLMERGYYVRVGSGYPNQNIAASNRWGSDFHIPIHSNASGNTACGGTAGGTLVMYYSGSTRGRQLAEHLRLRVGEGSPGTNDITRTANEEELRETNMPAAYLETEFHDWKPGTNWLRNEEEWAWRIGYSVDDYLDYPPSGVQPPPADCGAMDYATQSGGTGDMLVFELLMQEDVVAGTRGVVTATNPTAGAILDDVAGDVSFGPCP